MPAYNMTLSPIGQFQDRIDNNTLHEPCNVVLAYAEKYCHMTTRLCARTCLIASTCTSREIAIPTSQTETCIYHKCRLSLAPFSGRSLHDVCISHDCSERKAVKMRDDEGARMVDFWGLSLPFPPSFQFILLYPDHNSMSSQSISRV